MLAAAFPALTRTGVGSSPTGLTVLSFFDKSFEDVRRLNPRTHHWSREGGPRVRLPQGALATVPYNEGLQTLAHRVEHQRVPLEVTGSNPVSFPTAFVTRTAPYLRVA